MNDLNATGRAYELERREREPLIGRDRQKSKADKSATVDDSESDEEEEEEESSDVGSEQGGRERDNDDDEHSLVCWDIETRKLPGESVRPSFVIVVQRGSFRWDFGATFGCIVV
ncbi:MAG: hypothetical protein GY737_03020 [Desulfobacteraceae bacterium]|nr:hypothetical protein [Desulfobacteraceae bacterium]